MRGCDLRGANLVDAILTGADLTGAALTRAEFDADTRLPEGFDWRAGLTRVEVSE